MQGAGIPEAIYESDWFASSERFKKLMLITMQRLHRPIVLTIGKFAPLTLNNFVTVRPTSSLLFSSMDRNKYLHD